ncbi:MAG TPA: hypothetical protein VH165_06530 [Kofleriaceae bacterium]|nr:hypothetical protein [Kofleriaceae bacterium]
MRVPLETTETYSQRRRLYHNGPDRVTALRIYGVDIELALVLGRPVYLIGRDPERCDLRVPCKHIAAVNARIERILESDSLRVTDVSDGKNQIVFRRVAAQLFCIVAGDSFSIGETTFIAINEEMQLERPLLSEIFGAQQYRAIDDLLRVAIDPNEGHIVLVGEPGCGQSALAGAIHQISRRRQSRKEEVEPATRAGSADRQKIRSAMGGTLTIHLPLNGKFDPEFIAAATSSDAGVRLIVCAHSLRKAQASFPAGRLRNVTEIGLTALRHRREEIPGLLDKWFAEKGSRIRFGMLKKQVQDKLLSYSWGDNLDELRASAVHLEHLSHYSSERQATKDTNITRKASRYWRGKIGLSVPIMQP